jgi:hypothetical protein
MNYRVIVIVILLFPILPVLGQKDVNDISLPKDSIAKAMRATVIVRTIDGGLGSGFIISTNGLLLTNYHVIEGATKALVEFHDGVKLPVLSVLSYSPKLDLALLRIKPGNYECLELQRPDNISLGDSLFIIGHPHGHYWTLTKGYLAGKRTENGRPIIQFSADISPGNSGGPVMHLDGKVCGIATYLERQKLDFNDGKYILDPSSVLKFGIAVDAFIKITNSAPKTEYSLKQIAEFNEKLVAVNILYAVIDHSSDLLVDLHSGIKNLRVHVNRSYDYSYRTLGGGYRPTGTETIVYNARSFIDSAVRLRAMAVFLNEYIDDNTGDYNIDNAVRYWRDSMNAALRSINHTVNADGATETSATRRVAAVKDEFDRSVSAMQQALEYANKAFKSYGPYIRNPIVGPQRINQLNEIYSNARLRL